MATYVLWLRRLSLTLLVLIPISLLSEWKARQDPSIFFVGLATVAITLMFAVGVATCAVGIRALVLVIIDKTKPTRVLIVGPEDLVISHGVLLANFLRDNKFEVVIRGDLASIAEYNPDVLIVLCATIEQHKAFDALLSKPKTLWMRFNTKLLFPDHSLPINENITPEALLRNIQRVQTMEDL